MNQPTNSSVSHNAKSSSALNIGIGMLIGLIIALVVAYFAMSSGPFRDKSNKNVLTDTQGSNTDPNAPLYSKTSAPPMLPANEQGVGLLNDTSTNVVNSDVSAVLGGGNDGSANNSMASAPTTSPKKAQSDDAIANLIAKQTQSKAPASVSNTSSTSSTSSKLKTPGAAPNNPSQSKVSAPDSMAAKPKTNTNTSAPKTNAPISGTAPKSVTPVTANNKNAP